MAKRIVFELAKEVDDGALRKLLRSVSMDGDITLTFEREPNYFIAERLGNIETQTVAVRDTVENTIVGCSTRFVRRVYINGEVESCGYFGGLRIRDDFQGSRVFGHGCKFVHSLHQASSVLCYFTTILEENTRAIQILTSRRGGLPVYEPLGTITTGLIPLTKQYPNDLGFVRRFQDGQDEHSKVLREVNGYNSTFQYAPHYTQSDFLDGNTLRGFSFDNMYLFSKQNTLYGTLGVWDQNEFKQSVVRSYSTLLAYMRPFYNLYARLRKIPILPPVGSRINTLYGSFLSVKDNDPVVFRALMCAVQRDWSNRGYAYLAIGLHQDHPLLSTLESLSTRTIRSKLFLVYWSSEEEKVSYIKRTVPHVEIATL